MSDSLQAFSEARAALVKEREMLAARIAEIDAVLGGAPKGLPRRGRRGAQQGSLMGALERYVSENPGLSTAEIRAGLGIPGDQRVSPTLYELVKAGRARKEKGPDGRRRFYPPHDRSNGDAL